MMATPETSKDDGGRAAEAAAEADDAVAPSARSSPSTAGGDDDEERTTPPPPAPAPEASTVLLRIRGLPYGANESDVETFFGDNSGLVAAYICRRSGPFSFS